MARLIDADALEKMAIPCVIHNGALTELCVPLYQIRTAPTLPNPCGNPCNFTRPTGEHKCVTCKHCKDEIFNNYCRECSRAWADLYEEAEND